MDWMVITALLLLAAVILIFRLNRDKINEYSQAEELSQKGMKVTAVIKGIKDAVPDNKKMVYHLTVQYTVGLKTYQADYLHEMSAGKAVVNAPKKGDCLEVYTDAKNSGAIYNRPSTPGYLKNLV